MLIRVVIATIRAFHPFCYKNNVQNSLTSKRLIEKFGITKAGVDIKHTKRACSGRLETHIAPVHESVEEVLEIRFVIEYKTWKFPQLHFTVFSPKNCISLSINTILTNIPCTPIGSLNHQK